MAVGLLVSSFTGTNPNELRDKSRLGNGIHCTCPIKPRGSVDQSAAGRMCKMI